VIEYHLPTVTVQNQVTVNGTVTIESGNVVDFRSSVARPIRNRMSVGREFVSMTMTQRLRRSAIETPELPIITGIPLVWNGDDLAWSSQGVVWT
jgi:hypothetical protein